MSFWSEACGPPTGTGSRKKTPGCGLPGTMGLPRALEAEGPEFWRGSPTSVSGNTWLNWISFPPGMVRWRPCETCSTLPGYLEIVRTYKEIPHRLSPPIAGQAGKKTR